MIVRATVLQLRRCSAYLDAIIMQCFGEIAMHKYQIGTDPILFAKSAGEGYHSRFQSK